MTEESQTTEIPVDDNTGDTAAAPTATDSGLPDDAKERTKERFDELTKQLAEEKKARKSLEDAYKTLRTTPKEPEVTQLTKSIVDEETGYIDGETLKAYQARTEAAEKNALEAKKLAEQLQGDAQKAEAKRKEDLEAEEAYKVHPDLRPGSENFNEALHEMSTAILLRERFMNGKDLTFKDAADQAKKAIMKVIEKAKAEGATETEQQLDAKDRASVDTTGSPSRARQAQSDLDELRVRSRSNTPSGVNALVTRISRFRQAKP